MTPQESLELVFDRALGTLESWVEGYSLPVSDGRQRRFRVLRSGGVPREVEDPRGADPDCEYDLHLSVVEVLPSPEEGE